MTKAKAQALSGNTPRPSDRFAPSEYANFIFSPLIETVIAVRRPMDGRAALACRSDTLNPISAQAVR